MFSALKKILENPFSILFLSSILVFVNAWPAYALMRAGWFTQDSAAFAITLAISAFLIMFVVPALIIRYVLKRPLKEFGLNIPENLTKILTIIGSATLVLLPFLFFFAGKISFQQYYLIKQGLGGLFFLQILASCLYFFAEEFMFRGVLFFGLWDKFKYNTFWISNLIFAVFHLNKPHGEALFAFFAGLLLSYTALKTKSFLPATIIHAVIALVLNLIILFHAVA